MTNPRGAEAPREKIKTKFIFIARRVLFCYNERNDEFETGRGRRGGFYACGSRLPPRPHFTGHGYADHRRIPMPLSRAAQRGGKGEVGSRARGSAHDGLSGRRRRRRRARSHRAYGGFRVRRVRRQRQDAGSAHRHHGIVRHSLDARARQPRAGNRDRHGAALPRAGRGAALPVCRDQGGRRRPPGGDRL